MDGNDVRLLWVEKIGSMDGLLVNLAELRKETYDVAVYQSGGEVNGSYFRGRSLQDIGTLLEFVENTVICVSPSNKPWGELQWA